MFASRLKALRAEKHVTQVQLAEILGVSKGAVAMWEIRKREPNFDKLKRLANIFGVSTDYILGHERGYAMDATEAKLREKFSLKFAIEVYGDPNSQEISIRTILDPEVKPGAENQWVNTAAAAVAQELRQHLAFMLNREKAMQQSIAQSEPVTPGPSVFEGISK